MSQKSFADLGVSSAVAGALAKRGITTPFPVQRLVTEDVLAGHDVLVKSPTGSGKTLAFGIPLVDSIEATDRRPAALVLAPTRELASQIVEEIRGIAHARALSITAVYGGVGIQPQIRNAPKSHILVATPGRLEDLLDRRAVSLLNVKVLILDEADRMLDMGFKPAVDRIVRQTPKDRQTLLFSATLDGEVGRIADAYTSNPRRHEHAPRQERALIEHRFVAVKHEAKVTRLVETLDAEDGARTLVFVRTKRGADRLVKKLDGHRVRAVAMHGNKSQGQRQRALAAFERGDVDTLVATDVAARGIDVSDISHVVNFDAPDDREGYTHRVGRTGRAGRTGVGITFVMHEQARDVHAIARQLDLEDEFSLAGLAAPRSEGRPQPNGRRQNGRQQNGRGPTNGNRPNGRAQQTSGRRNGQGQRRRAA
jgi:superfamily II DNA/RNA helicase